MTPEQTEILLVEDNPNDLELVLHALRRENLANRVAVARDGEEALDYVFCRGLYSNRSPGSPPKLILLDLKIPKVDGIEVIRRIKENPATKAIPVVILTASKEETDLAKVYLNGANGYIQKPVDFDQFRETVKQVGLFWLVVNQPPPLSAFETVKL